MGNLIFFPVQTRELQDDWEETLRVFEKRLGGVKIADLEDGDEEAVRITMRSLRKDFMKLASRDVEKYDSERR